MSLERIRLPARAFPPAVVALFSLNLSYLLRGGVSLRTALDLLQRAESSPRFKRLINDLSAAVTTGSMMSSAMQNQSCAFSDVSIALVRAAEHDGTLGSAFNEIANLINQETESQDRLRNAMAYPLLLGIAVLSTLVFMIAYLTPAVRPLLMSVGAAPGFITYALFWLAEEGATVAVLLALLPSVLVAFFVFAKFNHALKLRWHRYLLQMWIMGDVRRDICYARLCRVVARLLGNGLEMDQAIAVANSSVDNVFIYTEVQQLRLQMQVGNRFSQSLIAVTSAPIMLMALMSAAEASGEVAPALLRASDQLDEQARTKLAHFSTIVPPMLVCTLGFVLLALVAGLLAPLFSSALMMGATL